ncbi:universal stress protein [Amycolatopsis sp. cg5]|uniref:universal stress protein n=1 Tax=Amycolatopsis sp. cg5 TaxID=3238802 RepID=UPI0035258288
MDASKAPVVVAVDGSAAARRAVGWAALAAARRGSGLRLLHAIGLADVEPGSRMSPPPEWFVVKRAMAETILADAVDAVAEVVPGLEPELERGEGAPLSVLVEATRRAARLVLGAPDSGMLLGLLAGSPVLDVTGSAHCPVVVVRGTPVAEGPIVVGVDGGDGTTAALDAAVEEAADAGARVVAVHAGSDFEADKDRYPDVEWVVKTAKPRQLLLEYSESARLMVVGSRGRGGFAGLVLGSTCHALIHHAACPVMVARP